MRGPEGIVHLPHPPPLLGRIAFAYQIVALFVQAVTTTPRRAGPAAIAMVVTADVIATPADPASGIVVFLCTHDSSTLSKDQTVNDTTAR